MYYLNTTKDTRIELDKVHVIGSANIFIIYTILLENDISEYNSPFVGMIDDYIFVSKENFNIPNFYLINYNLTDDHTYIEKVSKNQFEFDYKKVTVYKTFFGDDRENAFVLLKNDVPKGFFGSMNLHALNNRFYN